MKFDSITKIFSVRRPVNHEQAHVTSDVIAVAEAFKIQGNECLKRGELNAAENYYQKAIHQHPRFAEALNNLGYIYKEQKKYVEAEGMLSHALALKPELGQAQFNLGIVKMQLGHPDQAETCYKKALQLMPNDGDVYSFLANALHQQGKFEDACEALQQALALNPDDAEARWVLALTKIPAMWSANQDPHLLREDLLTELDELDKWFHPGRIGMGHLAVGSVQPFYLAYQEVSNTAVMARYGALCNRLMDHWPQLPQTPPVQFASNGRIKIGIVSNHIYNHSVWIAIIKGWMQHLNHDKFELYVIYLDNKQDAETALARSLSTVFIEGKSTLEEWVENILAHQIEVLMFPEIGMETMTAKLANLRLAPVQVASWGHPETSGLPTIDYYFSAEYFEGKNAEKNYTEKLVKLPHLGCCYSPLDVMPINPNMGQLHIDPHRPLLLSPCAPFKYAPQYDKVFVEIARRIGSCQIVFFAEPKKIILVEKLRKRLEQAFLQAGLDYSKYCVFVPWLDRPAFYGLMQHADVFLDSIGFSGFNTAIQAIECGLPVVTREGRFMRGRLASGILKRMGLTELVVESEEAYISLVVKLVADKSYARAVKQNIEKSRHLLFNDLAPIHAFEDFLVGVCRSTSSTKLNNISSGTSEIPNLPDNNASKVDFVWQLLDTESHMHTLKPGNAPVGLLEMVIPSPRRILDVGCFCGGSGSWLKQRFPGCEIVGIEMLNSAAAKAAQIYDRVISKTLEQIDFDAEGIAAGSFDAIIAADILEHLYNPWQALQRLKPLLAPGGAIYISLPNVRNLGLLSSLVSGEWKYLGSGLLDITHIRFFTRAQAIEMLEQTGWHIDDLRINPDPNLMASLQGQELNQIRSINAGLLRLENLTQQDVAELFSIQFHIRATIADGRQAN